MSRKPTTTSSVVKPTSAPATALPSDICPVCKRVRYLNTDMEFLINPECYHPMCSNCVTNIFKSGPAQCPYASCTKTLRHRGFRSAFFGDLSVEREVDIRRRVAAAFNNAEDDFESLRAFNDYLQDVEDLTFDLVGGAGADDARRAAAEQKLLHREQQFRDEIERNRKRGRDAESARQQRAHAAAEASRRRRREEARDDARARAEEAALNAEVMEALARGEAGSAADIQARLVARKRARVAALAGPSLLDPASSSSAVVSSSSAAEDNLLSIRGLKLRRSFDEDEEDLALPYSPYAGVHLDPTRYALRAAAGAAVHDAYPNSWLADARARDDHRVPGYRTDEYVARALFDAFAGLGVFVGDEKADAGRAVGTVGAAAAAGTGRTTAMGTTTAMEVDDVFG
ncbi:CDK-activating kinase assembly factor MAT1-domain-containing protein [Xylariomycetidae sp. FL0641]|nr:CDK-activating kinase assembly factor MAT1-domain-containing protein [Xylariomycetidae sp. FL0641]